MVEKMANPILLTLTPPNKSNHNSPEFYGNSEEINSNYYDDQFKNGKYQLIISLEEEIYHQCDNNSNVAGVFQKPIILKKYVDIDTPFFKWCCHNKIVIPEVLILFFDILKGDQHLVNNFTIRLTNVLVAKDKIIFHDYTNKEMRDKPYLEEVALSSSHILWEYRSDTYLSSSSSITEFSSNK